MSSSVAGADVVQTARTYLGVPYSWGGASPSGFDCSGFTDYVLGRLGINIGRTTVDQYQTGYPVPVGPAGNPMVYAQPGDLVFFGMDNLSLDHQHVGIYTGNNTMIDSPNSTSTVRFDDVTSWSPDEPLSGIRRVTTGGNSTAGATLISADGSPTAAAAGPAEHCLINAPSQSFGLFSVGGNCLMGTAQARALLGSAIIVGGGILMLGGLAIIVSGGKQAQLVKALTKIPGVGTVRTAGSSAPRRRAPGPLSDQDKADLNLEMAAKRNKAERASGADVKRRFNAQGNAGLNRQRDLSADQQQSVIDDEPKF